MSDADRQRLVVRILGEALELDGDARGSFLDRACGADRELREELDALLGEETAVGDGFLDEPAGRFARAELLDDTSTLEMTAPFESTPPRTLDRLGPYRVVGTLGRGGMGTVYLGEQDKPVRRRVALKIIDAIHDRRLVQRFRLECQALAHLAHPNIAALYEVGATEDDHPFVAMELVEGATIIAWCDERQLRLRQRLELFFGVCAGVRHAHEKGILHRDLKPRNVLVTEIDGRPTAKVIDFGIAKALDEPLLAGAPQMTLDHQIVGSPAYMSPETISGQRDLDTRSDVYALGMLLYELLAGVLPFDVEKELLPNILRRLVSSDLPPPSQRLAGLEPETRKGIAKHRMSGDESLQRNLRGDLDAIVAKAIARDRDQRYSSPADLAADLERHLENRPVTARPASLPYVLGRYLRRHMGVVAAVSALILALAAGVVVSTREARRANLEAQRAQEVSRFLVELFETADPERDPDEPVDVRELLDRGAERLREELLDQPLARATLLHTISDVYTKMALFEQAEALAAEALELRRTELPAEHRDLLASLNQLGIVYRRQSRFEEAEPLFRRVLEALEHAAEPEPLAIAKALNSLGNLLWSDGRPEEALPVHQRALEIRQHEPAAEDRRLAESLNNVGVLMQSLRRYEEAESHLLRADEIFVQILGAEHPVRAAGLNNLGMVEHRLRKWQESDAHLRQAAAIWNATYGDRHPRTLSARINLARLMLDLGHDEQAVPLLRDILGIQEELSGLEHRSVASTLTSLGIALGRLGDFDAAEASFQRTLAIYSAARGDEHRRTLAARSNLAWVDWRRGRFAEAEAEHWKILEIRKRTLGPDHDNLASSLRHLGLNIAAQGRDEEAENLFRRSLAIREAKRGKDHRRVGEILLELGELVHRAGRTDEARRLLDRALDIYRENLPPDHRNLRRAREALAAVDPAATR